MPYDTIPREEEIEVTCPFCGKTRTYYYRKGYTWVDYSTARSSYMCRTISLIDGNSQGKSCGGAIYRVIDKWNRRAGEQDEVKQK